VADRNHAGGKRDIIRGYALIRAAIDRGIPDSMTDVAQLTLNDAATRLKEKDLALAKQAASRLMSANNGTD
jgi:hypothetical protein